MGRFPKIRRKSHEPGINGHLFSDCEWCGMSRPLKKHHKTKEYLCAGCTYLRNIEPVAKEKMKEHERTKSDWAKLRNI